MQAGFRPDRSTVDYVFLLSQSITDFFTNIRDACTILATVNFAKAFVVVWHSALLSKLFFIGLLLCFLEWNDLSDCHSKFSIYNSRNRLFRLCRGVP